ncbi:MAG: 2-C-methyl-D-erythritol 2,4-cyclodiphosphate synthase [Nitrospirota bacterium]
MRIGFGYDSHRFVRGRRLILGGIEIPSEKGLLGHSDGDALIHAIVDSIIGALGLGDIGKHFPDSEERWRNASSISFLRYALELASEKGFKVSWIDATVLAEAPRIAPHVDAMKEKLSEAGVLADILNIKAKTNEGMGFIGRGEGIAVYAVCILREK